MEPKLYRSASKIFTKLNGLARKIPEAEVAVYSTGRYTPNTWTK
jgi:hypothetical protein